MSVSLWKTWTFLRKWYKYQKNNPVFNTYFLDLKVTEPYFSSSVRGYSSFVAYPLPEGIFQSMEIKFRFTPTNMEQISILLFIGQNGYHDFYSDHLAVSFVKGYIMLTWNLGSGNGTTKIINTECKVCKKIQGLAEFSQHSQ